MTLVSLSGLFVKTMLSPITKLVDSPLSKTISDKAKSETGSLNAIVIGNGDISVGPEALLVISNGGAVPS